MRSLSGLPLLLALIVLLATTSRYSGYILFAPGGTYPIERRLRVPDDVRQPMGRFAFTAVLARDASWADVISAWFSQTRVVPEHEYRPPGTSQREINESNRRQMEESKPVAAVVALRAAGYDVRVGGEGADVNGVVDGMPAEGVLRAGDLIVAADDQPIQTANDLVEVIRRRQPGDEVRLRVVRDGATLDLTVGTRASPTEPGRPMVGVYITTRGFDVRLPFPVEIDTDGVGGASAGLMFALGVLDAVTTGDLTRGYAVAGTGTIAVDGLVGPIGGAAEKVVAAERDGMELFLVPAQNFDEARRRARTVRVVPVERFDDAVAALCGLSPRGTATDVPPPCASVTQRTG